VVHYSSQSNVVFLAGKNTVVITKTNLSDTGDQNCHFSNLCVDLIFSPLISLGLPI